MKPYAERLPRLLCQLLADAAAIGWLFVVVQFAMAARDLVLRLHAPATGLADAGTAIGDAFATAARTAQNVPFIGGPLADALRTGQAAGLSMTQLGQEQYDAVTSFGAGTGLVLVLVGALPLVLGWLPLRVHYARTARAAADCRERDLSLLALRALTSVPVGRLRKVAEDPAAAWRRDDRDAVIRLAALELGRLGLRAPRSG
jgi:hypothetical protein